MSVSFQDHATVIKAIYTGSEFIESAAYGNEIGIVLESTSFYAEQGGQVHCTSILIFIGYLYLTPRMFKFKWRENLMKRHSGVIRSLLYLSGVGIF